MTDRSRDRARLFTTHHQPPPDRQSAMTDREDRPVSAPPAAPTRRVVVIEDNRDSADSLGMLIGLLGHDCRVCYDARSGMEEARRHGPHVLLCDVGLPDGVSGYDVAAGLRAELPHTLFVAVTGYGRDEDVKKALASGFDRHLIKPADPDELCRLLSATRPGGPD